MKVSEILGDVAYPWVNKLGADPPIEVMRAIFGVVADIWNASREPSHDVQDRRIAEITDLLEQSLPGLTRQQVEDLMTEMYATALFRYDDDPRIVVEVTVEPQAAGKFNILAVSAGPDTW